MAPSAKASTKPSAPSKSTPKSKKHQNGTKVPVKEIEMGDGVEDDESGSEIFEGVEGEDSEELGSEDEDEEGDEEEEDDEMLSAAEELELASGESEADDMLDDEEGGAPLSPSQAPLIGRNSPKHVLNAPSILSAAESSVHPDLNPQKPIPYNFDAGNLLVDDPNPLPPSATEAQVAAAARDATQSLLNHLLTTCPIRSSSSAGAVLMTLPKPTTILPREKRVPTPKEMTKWEKFAAKKGIGKNKQVGEGRAGKLVFDQNTGEWVPRYGFKGKNKSGEDDWLVEVDEKKEDERRGVTKAAPSSDNPRAGNRAERKARVKRNERAQRANERRSRPKAA